MDTFSIASIIVMAVLLLFSVWKRVDLVPLLIMANLLVFMITIISPWVRPFGLFTVQMDLSFRPVYLQTGENLYTIFTHMFVHADILHLLFNMLFLYLIGVTLEDRIGKSRFAAVYFIAGTAGVLVQSFMDINSRTFILGASGAISGAMGAMLLLYPRDEIPFFLGPIFLPRIPVWISVGSWFCIQVLLAFTSTASVAYGAHLGGFLAGMAVAVMVGVRGFRAEEKGVKTEDLRTLATTPELRNALEEAARADHEELRRAWLEYFAERAICPRCGSRMKLEGNKILCRCGYQIGTGLK